MGKIALHSSVPDTSTGELKKKTVELELADMELDEVCENLEVLLLCFVHSMETGGDLVKSNQEIATVAMNALRYCRDLASLLEVCTECALEGDACFTTSPAAKVH